MEQTKLNNYKFFKSLPFRCSYISGKFEQRLFSKIEPNNQKNFNTLMENGFRRNLDHMYIPICENCNSCISSRIKVNDFIISKSQKRNINQNKFFTFKKIQKNREQERYNLFIKYLKNRHSDGQMKEMTFHEFSNFVYDSPVKNLIFDIVDENNRLSGSIILDILKDGLSAVYSFYDTKYLKNGLGKFLILKSIQEAKKMKFKYLYLGYWIKESKKMNYKANFNNLEIFINGNWKLKDL